MTLTGPRRERITALAARRSRPQTDFRFDGESVSVLKDGETIDSDITFLGGCLGQGAYLGAGCILAPGRAIANGWRISREAGVIKSGLTGAVLEGLRVIAPRFTLSK